MGGNGGNTSKGGSKDVQTYIIQEYKAYFFKMMILCQPQKSYIRFINCYYANETHMKPERSPTESSETHLPNLHKGALQRRHRSFPAPIANKQKPITLKEFCSRFHVMIALRRKFFQLTVSFPLRFFNLWALLMIVFWWDGMKELVVEEWSVQKESEGKSPRWLRKFSPVCWRAARKREVRLEI